MRINPPLTILAIIAATFGVLAWRGASTRDEPASSASDDRCDVVIAFLKRTLADDYLRRDGRLLFLITEEAHLALPLDDLTGEVRDQLHDDPFHPLYVELLEFDGVDPREECASLREFLKQDDVRERFTEVRPKLRSEDEWDAVFVSVSMPALTEDGREAIMLSGLTFGPLAGGGVEVYLRKNRRDEWVVKYEQPTWIS